MKRYFQDIRDYKEIRDGGRRVLMSHYPIPFHKNSWDPDCWMLYGHVHETREYAFMERLRREVTESRKNKGDCVGNWINVGCMMPWMDYTPRTLDELIEGEGLQRKRTAPETRPEEGEGSGRA